MPFKFSSGKWYAPGDLFIGRDERGSEIGIKTERHAITFASSRSGKGVGLIIPNLLRWPHNVVVIDPSGEITQETWRARAAMGQKVVVLDPMRALTDRQLHPKFRASCNLLADIKPGLTAREDIRVIADGLVMRYKADDGTWDNGAMSVLAGLIAFVLHDHPPEERDLTAVRRLLLLPPRAQQFLFEDMSAASGYGDLAKAAAVIGLSGSKKNQDFVGGAFDHTEWLSSEGMAHMLQGAGWNSFRLSDLKTKPVSLFLVLPTEYLAEHGRFLRLFIRCALNAMMKGGTGGRQCLFVLDEFFSLGHLDQVEKAAGAIAKNGVHLWPFLQDLGQLQKLYGVQGSETFIANSDAQVFFCNDDNLTPEYVSGRLGTITPSEIDVAIPQKFATEVFTRTHISPPSPRRPYDPEAGAFEYFMDSVNSSLQEVNYADKLNTQSRLESETQKRNFDKEKNTLMN